MLLATLPITDVLLIAFVFAIAIFIAYRAGFRPSKRAFFMYLVLSVLLTLASMLIVGSRGGEPPAKIYGWPKEVLLRRGWSTGYFTVRNLEGRYFHLSYFVTNLIFYAIVVAGIDGLRHAFKEPPKPLI